jgi:hypothetical protein
VRNLWSSAFSGSRARACGTRPCGEASRARTRTSPTGARPLARMSVARPCGIARDASRPGRPPAQMRRSRRRGWVRRFGLSPRYAVTLRLNGGRPPIALGSNGRRQGESEEGLNLLKREHDAGGVAMFQTGLERPVLARPVLERNVRRTLLHRKDPRCALGNRRGPSPPRPDPFEQRCRPINPGMDSALRGEARRVGSRLMSVERRTTRSMRRR